MKHIHLIYRFHAFSCKRSMSTKIIRLELLEKLWLKTNMDIPCHDIPCFYFYFLFRNNGKSWMGMTSVAFTVIFFESVILKVLDHNFVPSPFSTIVAFERQLKTEDFTNMDRHSCRVCNKTFDLLLYGCLSLRQV